MDEQLHPEKNLSVTDVFKLVLSSNGPMPPEAGPELLELIRAAIPQIAKPNRMLRPLEFPDEIVDQVIDDIREIASKNPKLEADRKMNPPATDKEITLKAEAIQQAIRDLKTNGVTVRASLASENEERLENNSVAEESLERILRRRLGKRVRDLRVIVLPEGLVLQGRTNTYHAKQVAQHVAMELAGAPILANEIEVV